MSNFMSNTVRQFDSWGSMILDYFKIGASEKMNQQDQNAAVAIAQANATKGVANQKTYIAAAGVALAIFAAVMILKKK